MSSDSASPVLDFDAFGLTGAWIGHRWLYSVSGSIRRIDGVLLGHADDGKPADLAAVGTFPRSRFDAEEAERSSDPRVSMAFGAALTLLDMSWTSDQQLNDRVRKTAVDHMYRAAEAHETWPSTTWIVDGVETPTTMWKFAGGFAGFVTTADAYIMVATSSSDLQVVLSPVPDLMSYGIDRDAPLAEQHPDRWPIDDRPRGVHDDFKRLDSTSRE